MENNQELILARKPDLKALKKLQQDQRKSNAPSIEDYKEKRINLIENGERIEMDAGDYNEIIIDLIEILEDDFAEGYFSEEEFLDEKETLETLIFQATEAIDGVDGYESSEIQYDPKNLIKEPRFSNPEKMIRALKIAGYSYLMRRTGESTTIITGRRQFTYTHSTNFPASKLFLFNMVRRDVVKWLETHGDYEIPKEHNVTVFNYDYDNSHGEICGTDLNHAYWRIAFILGMISENTYKHGLSEDVNVKALRLATISILGREKSYREYKNGKPIRRVILQKRNPQLQGIFKFIRFHCFQMMHTLSKDLGDDFDSYQTDCIYYRNTPKNVRKVQNYFKKRNLLFKQLEFEKEESDEEE